MTGEYPRRQSIDPPGLRDGRYNVTKLMHLLLLRQLAAEMTRSNKEGDVVVSVLNPGFVDTTIMRNASKAFSLYVTAFKKVAARTPEEGGRTLVFAAYGGKETHGKYLDDCVVGKVSCWVVSEDGLATQMRLWQELSAKLDGIEKGVMEGV
jgi:retinol dehydrogenase-12